jgi:hypothetical protein
MLISGQGSDPTDILTVVTRWIFCDVRRENKRAHPKVEK